MKESSASTKLRVVTNFSVPRRGGSFNEQTLKGSCLIASSLEVLFGFSAHCFALMTDLSEAFRSTRTGPITNSCRRFFWWKDVDNEESLEEFILQVSMCGDKPAGNILAQALHIIATDDRVSELVKNFILKCFFVDDGIVSSSSKAKLLELAENLPRAFDNYSFKTKHVILSFVESTGVTLSDNIERFFRGFMGLPLRSVCSGSGGLVIEEDKRATFRHTIKLLNDSFVYIHQESPFKGCWKSARHFRKNAQCSSD